jgi:hypothetical protein
MPVTNTQDEWNRRRIDVRHINPSIMEGEHGHTSMFGQGSAVPIVRYAPTFLVQPSISGSFRIPSVLTCNPGVIDASPQAQLSYQWKANGSSIMGEIHRTLTTIQAFDNFEITCEVTAVNFLGVVVGESNEITADLVEPINNWDLSHFSITGLTQKNQQNVFKVDTLITTGISMDQRTDVLQQTILITSGMDVEFRNDMMSHTVATISGLGPGNGGYMHDLDVYTIWQPTRLADISLINPSAETGDMTGWNVTSGTIIARSTDVLGTTVPFIDKPWFFSSDAAGKNNSYMNQVANVDSELNADIDAGIIYSRLIYLFDNYTYSYGHLATGQIQFLNASDVVLDSHSLSHTLSVNQRWSYDYTPLLNVPVLTRKVRITIGFETFYNQDSHVYVDEIAVEMFKDEN